jgi:hypothetical protein
MIDGVFPLPPEAVLKVAAKFLPHMIAHFHGGDLFVAVGAHANPMTLVAFRAGGATDVRSYPQLEFTDEVYNALHERMRAGELDPFDGIQDWRSRDLGACPRQLLTIDDALVIVRYRAGHALIDPATLAIEVVPPSAVERMYPFAPGTMLVAAFGKYGNEERVQMFWTVEASRLREPFVRGASRSSEEGQSRWRRVDATPFPDEEGRLPLGGGIARVKGETLNYSHEDMHVASAIVWNGKLFGLALAPRRSGSDDHSIVRLDLASRKVDGITPLAKEDKTLDAVWAPSPAGMIAFADKAVLLIDPETLAVVDRAPLPKGIELVGSDADRLVLHHKRANTLFVVRNTALATPLGPALARVQAEIDGSLKTSRGAAKRKRV